MIDAKEKERLLKELFSKNERWLRLLSRKNAPKNGRQDFEQEIRMAFWKSLDWYNEASSNIGTWFHSVAMNTAMEFRRKNQNSRKRDERVYPNPGFVEQNQDDLMIIEEMTATLSELDRRVFTMFLDGFRYAEISEATGVEEGYLRRRMSLIKDHIKSIYGI